MMVNNQGLNINLHILSSQVASTACLEADNDICDFQVSFFFKVGKDTCSEKHFALPNSVEVWIQFQSLDLNSREENLIIY